MGTEQREEQTEGGRLIVISGPSGVGKSSVARRVLQRSEAVGSISTTTREPRTGERHGLDYYFVKRETFERMVAEDELLEWAEVFDNYYGTPAGPVGEALAAGRTVLLEIDVQGGLQVAGRCPDATLILITAPSAAELQRRLTGRGTDLPEVIAKRLAKAQKEIQTARDSGAYTHEVVNDILDDAVAEVLTIMRKET